uniref:PGG domain-containing protein n=1 Tax=Cajanus cajan TaxID=3821 RepID=A0A151THC1_CAJCA|nr:hypothetical protein KK1_012741 [Cajanus cajan]
MGRTVLHVAVIAGHEHIVEKLVNLGRHKLLKMQDNFDYTALALAADLTGNVNIARCMVGNYGGRDLLTIKTKDNEIPVLLSAVKGHKEMTRYLYQQTHLNVFLHNNSHYGVLLLTQCITAKIFGHREIYEHKRTHCLVLEILKCLCKRISDYKESQLREASAYDAMLQAAKLGIVEFIDAMRKANPDLLWAIDKNKRDIFSHAILNRKKDVFHLINGLNNGRKEIIKCRKDVFGNTLLHLAAYLGPSSHHKSGAALLIQRDLQWFKAVEKIVHPKCKEEKNANGKRPHEVFSESHVEMVKTGEKWAKDTAISFTLVGTFIIIIMFAATFTISGGNNQETGVPIFLHDHILTLFIIADVISIFSSSTSVLVFLGILASRYAEKDFLKTLPLKLFFGLVTLFLSMVAMMVAICALLVMLLKEYQRVIIAAMSLGSIPVIVLVPSLLGLFFDIFNSICMQHI